MGYMQQSTSVDQNNCRHGKGSNDSIQYEQYVRLSKRTKSLMILVNCLTLDYSLEGYWSIGSESFAKLTWMPHACLPSYLPTYMYWRWWRGSSSPLQDTPPMCPSSPTRGRQSCIVAQYGTTLKHPPPLFDSHKKMIF